MSYIIYFDFRLVISIFKRLLIRTVSAADSILANDGDHAGRRLCSFMLNAYSL